jgi:uncharacterized membrane protein YkoI
MIETKEWNMTRMTALSIAVAAGFLLSAGSAYADNDQPFNPGWDIHDAVQLARVPLSRAIATAQQTAGGKAVSADMVGKRSQVLYYVDLASSNGIVTVTIDAYSGRVLDTSRGGFLQNLNLGESSTVQPIGGASIDLRQAVKDAASDVGGTPIDANVSRTGAGLVYQVELAKGGSTQTVLVNPQSGQIL